MEVEVGASATGSPAEASTAVAGSEDMLIFI